MFWRERKQNVFDDYIAAAETLHGALELAHRMGQVIRQQVTEKDAGRHHPPMLRRQEPVAEARVRDHENEPIPAVPRVARDGRAAQADGPKAGLLARLVEQAGLVGAGEQVVPGRVGENTLASEGRVEAVRELLQTRLAGGLISGARLGKLESHHARQIGARSRQARNEGRSDGGDHQRGPEPQQDFGEERIHSGTSSGDDRLKPVPPDLRNW